MGIMNYRTSETADKPALIGMIQDMLGDGNPAEVAREIVEDLFAAEEKLIIIGEGERMARMRNFTGPGYDDYYMGKEF